MISVPSWSIACLVALLICSCTGLEVTGPESIAHKQFNAPRYRWVGPEDWSFDVTGRLVDESDTDVEDRIVLVGYTPAREKSVKIENLWRNKALAILLVPDSAPVDITGLNNYARVSVQYEVLIPTVMISNFTWSQLRAWLDEGLNVTVRVTSSDINEWDLAMQSGAMVFYSVLLSAFTATCIGLAAYKLAMFVKAKGCQESIPQTMLIFEIVANTLRLFPCAVDPLQSRTLLPYLAIQLFYTISWPFVIMNLLLISFYWHELMQKSAMTMNTFLAKLRIPFWVLFAVLLALDLTQSLLRGLLFELKTFITIIGVVYIVFGVLCVIFYIYTGTRLTRTMTKISKKMVNSNRIKRLRKTSRYIYASAGGVIVWLIAIAVGGLTTAFWLPWGFFSVWLIAFFATTFISLMQILAIHEPNPVCGAIKGSTDISLSKPADKNNGSSFNGSTPRV
jgi:hypothetical protein